MFIHHCITCSTNFLQSSRSILELHNSADGPIGVIECRRGHRTIVSFRTGAATEPVTEGRQPHLAAAADH